MVGRETFPVWRNTNPVTVDAATLRQAERLIDGCEACSPDTAEIPFDHVLDSVTGCDPEFTDYVLSESAHCPKCSTPLQAGYWRWEENEDEGRTVFILPGTLVSLKRE